MLMKSSRQGRRGTILPLLAITLVALCGFVALGIDVGLIAAAKTDCQNAADAAALTGTRNLDGSPSGNVAGATAKALAVAMANQVLGQAVQTADVTLQAGAYHYDINQQTFSPQFPPVSPDNYNLMQATVQHTVNYAFGRVFNLTSINVSASAIGAHRPRDTSIVLDYSGSMNNESDLWNCESYLGSLINTSNNTDPVFPQWGQYDPTWSPLAALQCTSSDARVGKCNVTQSVLGVPALVQNFYQNAHGAAAQPAFNTAPASVTNTTPGGEAAQSQVRCAQDINTAKGWSAFKGYKAAYGSFYGFRQGPGYWGKTFFIWPPDPTTPPPSSIDNVNPNTYPGNTQYNYTCDWRKRFFMMPGGSYPNFGGPVNSNSALWSTGIGSNGGGIWNDPPGNYVINYKAILQWIKNAGPNGPDPFPPVLRAGNVLFYDSIPDDVPSSAYDHTQPNRNITDSNQRFWKEYIDYTLGVWRDPFGNIQHPAKPSCSIGGDFTCGSSTAGNGVTISTFPDGGPNGNNWLDGTAQQKPYMNPTDNPQRPRHRFWFGPMTMIQYVSDTGLLPGTATDISMLPAKLGINGALTDIQTNHPNDLVSMILYSRPHYSGEPAEVGSFTQPQYSLSRDYTGMINSLWFPPNSAAVDVRPWDVNGAQTPRAHGDYCANTATSYGFMLAYNQFSSSAILRSQTVGGLGRKGAQRLLVLETDGMANVATTQSFTNAGANNSYYNVTPSDSPTVSGNAAGTDAIQVAQRICALTTDNANGPGFSTPSKPVLIHCIAFGAIFEPTAQDGQSANAMSMLQTISSIGKTGFPASVTATSDPNYYKLCIGTLDQRQTKLRKAFSLIMDDGIAVVMVK